MSSKKERDPKSPASVLQRLRNQRAGGQSVQNAQVLFILERFLARVAASPHRDKMVLKGGILLYLLMGEWTRPTEDLDFLALRMPSENLERTLSDILALDLDDRLEFLSEDMTSEDIREESGYPCRRFIIPYRFGDKHAHVIKLDLSFGDPITPGPRPVEVRPLLDGFQGGTVLGYPIETYLAEKVETMLVRGLANTRAKDLFDLWVLARTSQLLRLGTTTEALTATAKHRGTDLRLDYVALHPAYKEDARLERIWNAYVRSKGLAAPSFSEVVDEVQLFIQPVVAAALFPGLDGEWDSARKVWR